MAAYAWLSVPIQSDDERDDEPLGTKVKFWVQNPDDESLWLFKFARITTGRQMGEDWAEWIAHHVARLLGVPCAEIRPAHRENQRGIVSKNVVDMESGQRLVLGNSLLVEADPAYDQARGRANPGYTVAAVAQALQGVDAPPGDLPASMTGFGAWAGYLVLDALIAGRDRHHENWGAIRDGGELRLAPTFDHGNALGFQEPDENASILAREDERREVWLRRGRSHHFSGKPKLVDLAVEALHAAGTETTAYWSQRVEAFPLAEVHKMVEAVPRDVMSEATARFVPLIVRDNRRRLLDALGSR